MSENKSRNKSILDILTGVSASERLDKIILDNEEYIKTQDRISEAAAEYKSLCLSDEECAAVDRLVAAYNANGACYARTAYQQGVKDCAALFRELELI